ncbi:2'-5' RNA ligase family protein [Bosea sp. TAB14]|jgi:2'-5' RNA ligase|uniref:2'-5' RNA ligase family protein n=1 Tax=Bosea sp. TAB14 TaxID=3237481 RepID=UPI001152C0BC
MTTGIHSLWLLPAADDEAMMAALVGELSGRFGTPIFAPHLTLRGDTPTPPAALERAVAEAAATVEAFAEPVAVVEGSDAFFRSFYARFAVSSPLAKLKRALDPDGLDSFMPHVSLLYGPVVAAAKAEAIREVNARLAGRSIRFDRIGVVTSGQDVPIAEWRVVAQASLRSA